MSTAIRPGDRHFLAAVAALAYANPFSTEREDLERAALGGEFLPGDPIWSVSVADPARPRPNIWRVQEKLGPVLDAVRARLLTLDDAADWPIYEECVHSFLYQRYYESFVQANGNWSFYRKFAADWDHYLRLPGKRYPSDLTVEHFFACCWQLYRAFHRIFDHIIGSSRPAARLRGSIWESIFTCDLRRYRRVLWRRMGDFPTLITGPSGTGKELVARAIAGARYLPFLPGKLAFDAPPAESFFAVNLAALSPALIESELFGHKRGSFTGAAADRAGWLEACPRQGSVFLDELGEMEMPIQVKLLRVLETREYAAVGDVVTKRFEGKLIAATNRDLATEIAAGRFREDLYYRLCADLITTPSLASQIDDAPAAFPELLFYMTRRTVGDEADEVFPAVRDWIATHLPASYRWPGNYRELEQCVRNVLIRQTYRPLSTAGDSFADRLQKGELTAEEVLVYYTELVYRQCGSYVETARRLDVDRRTVKARLKGLLGGLVAAAEDQE
ncbi:MAG: sigma 54-interacting transcriptional regulator [Bryobacteraceae bacterium]|nr:sigma 54-interacting transcriptional regulator [Bryobacteraceae bacterium]